ncbi:uncharacterized protein A4U43_C07F22050 [Asparagus officinalis]|uniref:Uncharacterized protein n=1 Tax=Asparagus officinalis TaxID=4686 RepID=A0A5P1EFV8_ASPOF|nr:uncharacterized protein A4U43_C07F22050 [Asparagus officinalis]
MQIQILPRPIMRKPQAQYKFLGRFPHLQFEAQKRDRRGNREIERRRGISGGGATPELVKRPSIDLPRIDRIIRCSLGSQGLQLPAIEPVPEASVSIVEERTPADRERWWKRGLKAISEGKLAVVLLSGGQPREGLVITLKYHLESSKFSCTGE